MLEVACYQCQRKGRYRVTRLIDRHGAGMELVELKTLIAGDCPKQGNVSYFQRCGVNYPLVANLK